MFQLGTYTSLCIINLLFVFLSGLWFLKRDHNGFDFIIIDNQQRRKLKLN